MSLSSLYRMLRSRFYYGVIERTGRLYAGVHTPMVSREEFEQVQRQLGRRNRSPRTRRSFPYSQLIRCGACDGMITGEETTNRYGKRYMYYHCARRSKGARCRQPSVRSEALEEKLLDFTRSIRLAKPFRRWAIDQINAHRRDRTLEQIASDSATKARRDAEHQLARLTDLYLAELIDEDEYRRRKQTLEADLVRFKRDEAAQRPAGRSDIPVELADVPVQELVDRRLRTADVQTTRKILSLIG